MLTRHSTLCWLATCHSTTIQRIPRATTSISCTSTLSPHLSRSPSTSHRTQETFSRGYWSPTRGSAPICSRLRDTVGWPTMRTSWASSLQAMPPRTSSKALSMLVSSPSARITMFVMLIAKQKSHTSSHPHSPEVLRSASQRRRKHLHQYMAGLQPSETRSTRQRSRRPPATTSAAPFRSNTLPLSRRHSAAKHPQRPRQHQKLALSSAYPSNLQAQLQTATSPPLVRDHLAPPDKALLPKLDR